jgi:hypothetical protein
LRGSSSVGSDALGVKMKGKIKNEQQRLTLSMPAFLTSNLLWARSRASETPGMRAAAKWLRIETNEPALTPSMATDFLPIRPMPSRSDDDMKKWKEISRDLSK